MKTKNKRIPGCIVLILALSTTLPAGINPQFFTQRHSSNTRYNGLSNAGVAIPEAVTSIALNPSLVHYWHFANQTKYSASAAYERDSVFSKSIISTGASWYINEKTTIGTLYRNLRHGDDNYQNEVVLCTAGRLFDKSLNQGAVNLGMNIRFERMNWRSSGLDSLPILHKIFDDSGKIDTVIQAGKYKSDYLYRFLDENRLLFDLGFFQDNILPGLDFGLSLYNLFGFAWQSDRPSVGHRSDTIWDSTFIVARPDTCIDTAVYTNTWEKERGGIDKVYKRMAVGLAYHANIMQDKVTILIPFDLEFLGLFDRSQKIKLGFSTGIEAWLNNMVCLRFGYALSPKYITGTPDDITFKNSTIFSGGASVKFEHISCDIFLQGQNWGIGSTVAF